MARAIKLQDTVYEVDNGTASVAATAIITTMLLRMDAFNIGTDKKKLKKSATATAVIQAHVSGSLNVGEFGIHPRTIELERTIGTATSSACYGGNQKRKVTLIVPTLAQFTAFKVYDRSKGGTQADTIVKVSHSYDGKGEHEYTIVKKTPQFLV